MRKNGVSHCFECETVFFCFKEINPRLRRRSITTPDAPLVPNALLGTNRTVLAVFYRLSFLVLLTTLVLDPL